MKEMKRILIIGGPGTGKTTLANSLGEELDLQVYHLDGIHHLENWEKRDKDQRDEMILKIAKKEQWIMDGTYRSTLEKRVKRAEMILFLNYSTAAKLKGILSRYRKNKGNEKPDIPGCKEKMTWEFIRFTAKWNRTKKKFVEKVLQENQEKKIFIFKTRKELNQWYEKEFHKQIIPKESGKGIAKLKKI